MINYARERERESMRVIIKRLNNKIIIIDKPKK